MLPTDTQKNTVYAFAKEYGIESAEHLIESRSQLRLEARLLSLDGRQLLMVPRGELVVVNACIAR